MNTYFFKFLFDYLLGIVVLVLWNVVALITSPFTLAYAIHKEKEVPGAIRYFGLWLVGNVFNLISCLFSPVLPLFRRDTLGWSDNHHIQLVEPRLPSWLNWFMTPDNSLWGDNGWQTKHCVGLYQTYWGMAGWLMRNRGYGFTWGPLSAFVRSPDDIRYEGEINVDRNYPENTGKKFFAQMGRYFEYKASWKIPFIQRAFIFKCGWLLDAYIGRDIHLEQPNALFLFSPRIGRLNKDSK